MAKAMYAVVGGATKKIKSAYCVVGGVTKKLKAVYAVVDGKTKIVFSGTTSLFSGVVYPNVTTSGTQKNICKRNWNGSSFESETSQMWANMYNNSSRYYSFHFSKDGRVMASIFGGALPKITFGIFDSAQNQYKSIGGFDSSAMVGINSSNSPLIINHMYISSDGTKAVALVGSEKTTSYFVFFDINPDSGSVSIAGKSQGVSAIYYHSSSYGNTWSNGASGCSDNDEQVVFLISGIDSSGYESGSAYYINLSNNTAQYYPWYGVSKYPIAISSDGHYVMCRDTDNDTDDYSYYLNGTNYTYIDFQYRGSYSYGMGSLEKMFVKNGILYEYSNSGSIYCYQVNGVTITYLGKLSTYANKYSPDQNLRMGTTIYSINDIVGNTMLLNCQMYKKNTSGNLVSGNRYAINTISIDSSGVLTSMVPTNTVLGESCIANIGSYNEIRFVDMEE